MIQTLLLAALLVAAAYQFRKNRQLQRDIDTLGGLLADNAPPLGLPETPVREQIRAAVQDHTDRYHRRQ